MPLPHLVSFLLNLPRAGLQTELNAFFDYALQVDTPVPSKSALCQARRDLKPEAMRELLQHSAQAITANSEVPLWRGKRVLALDSTVLRVPNSPECIDHFGGQNCAVGKFRPLARASALIDVARDCIIDAIIGTSSDDDRTLAAQHLASLQPSDLVVMDRGYPSHNWLRQLHTQHIAYCARITHQSWSITKAFIRSNVTDQTIDLGQPDAPVPARLIRHSLPNGTMLVLVTNVMDPTIDPADFAELYHRRWRIEEAFKLIKARLQVENWSGCLPHTVIQDFHATLIRANCAAILALDARPNLIAADTIPHADANGWRQRLNRTLTNKSLRHNLTHLLLADDITDALNQLLQRLRLPSAIERTKEGRSNPRNITKVKIAGHHGSYAAA